jgi:DeoR/GlpR family transcriptional regulator of sugar metabolism
MLIDERHSEILGIVKEKTYVRVDELAEKVFASPATIRRDLTDLEKAGLVQRVRGGASIIGNSTGEISSLVRKQTNITEKRRIASKAASFLKDGQSYFIDSSTSAGQIIPLLTKTNEITIITNGLENALLLSSLQNIHSYIAGGQVQPRASSSIGSDAITFISNFNCDAFFFSCHGFSLKTGASEGTIEQQRCKKAMLKNSTKHILLVDHTKFGNTYVASVCGLSEIDVIVTDVMPSQEYVDAFKANDITLIVAGA